MNFREPKGILFSRTVGSGVSDSLIVFYYENALRGTISDIQGPGATIQHEWMPKIGKWYHVAFTFDHVTRVMRLLLDGEEVVADRLPGDRL